MKKSMAGIGKKEVAKNPKEHADRKDHTDSVFPEEERHKQEKENLRDLTQGHHSFRVINRTMSKENIGRLEVEGQRDANEQGADDEDGKGTILHQADGLETQNVSNRNIFPFELGRGMG